jgi:Heterokaryon incompatibility protein (HET)
MKHIYSKADVMYSWLGREEVDDTMAVFAFFMSLLDSYDDAALAQTRHTCISRSLACLSSRPKPPRNGDCPRCAIESCFQGLQHLPQRQYWKRRWIIQETSVSYRHVILCDEAAITLDDLDRAITQCRNPCYCGVGKEMAYSWFKTTAEFRRYCQEEFKPSLCQAFPLSRDFESTDPRDAIFSFLGLYYDGTELGPTPNYLQHVETNLANLTRGLI